MQANRLDLYEDAYLRDELGALGIEWASIIGSGLDFLGTKKQLDAQKDSLKVQLAAAEKKRQVALLELEAAKVRREATALAVKAQAQQTVAAKAASPLGFTIAGVGLPVLIGGALLLFRLLKR